MQAPSAEAGIDQRGLERDLLDILDLHYAVPIKNMNSGRLLMSITDLLRTYRVQLPPDLVIMIKALVAPEGTARRIHPELDVVSEAKAHISKLAARRYTPESVLRRLRLTVSQLFGLQKDISNRLEGLLGKADRNELTLGFRHENLTGLIHTFENVASRVTFGIIIAAMIIGSSMIIATGVKPLLFGFPALGVIGYRVSVFRSSRHLVVNQHHSRTNVLMRHVAQLESLTFSRHAGLDPASSYRSILKWKAGEQTDNQQATMRYPPYIEADFTFPEFHRVRRRFPRPRVDDVTAAVAATLAPALEPAGIGPGQRVAVGVGSRGIANLAAITAAACRVLHDRGAVPFIVPAMGSHGGATAEGQRDVLAQLGVDATACGCPVEPSMATVPLGQALDEVPVHYSAAALGADHAICINRVKPHTKFKATIASGLTKMLVVGLGKHEGAMAFHRWGLKHGFHATLTAMARVALRRSNFRMGLGVVENACDETMHIEALPAGRLLEDEPRLLALANEHFPRLPVRRLDVLVVRRIGKEISGAGMDANVTGRAWDLREDDFSSFLDATRVALLELSPKSGGNATGVGNADVITERLYRAIDYEKTVMNCLTGISLRKAAIPVRLPDDRKAIQACFTTIGPVPPDRVRAVIVQDTLHLAQFWASRALAGELATRAEVTVGKGRALTFDDEGNLKI